jgi:hypothetical protein
MANIEELQRALRQGSDAKARLSGLDEQYQQAQDRGVATTKKDQYGQVSPLSVLADVVGQSRSRRDMRELAPQREAARSTIAQHENAGALYNAVRQQKRDNVSDEQFGITHGLNKSKQAEVARQNQIKNDRYTTEQGQVKTPPVEYTDAEGNTRQLVSLGDGRWKDENRNIITSIAGWTKAADKTADVTKTVGYGNTHQDKEALKTLMMMGKAERVGAQANGLSSEAKAELNDGNVRLKEVLLNTFSPSKAKALIKSAYSGYSDEAKNFIVSLSRMSAEDRHALFGAALTQGEAESSEDFLARVEGLTLDQMMYRLSDTFGKGQRELEAIDLLGGGTQYADAVGRSGWDAFNTDPTQPKVIGTPDANQAEDGMPTITPHNAANARDFPPTSGMTYEELREEFNR